jgi:hypothetical protein
MFNNVHYLNSDIHSHDPRSTVIYLLLCTSDPRPGTSARLPPDPDVPLGLVFPGLMPLTSRPPRASEAHPRCARPRASHSPLCDRRHAPPSSPRASRLTCDRRTHLHGGFGCRALLISNPSWHHRCQLSSSVHPLRPARKRCRTTAAARRSPRSCSSRSSAPRRSRPRRPCDPPRAQP